MPRRRRPMKEAEAYKRMRRSTRRQMEEVYEEDGGTRRKGLIARN